MPLNRRKKELKDPRDTRTTLIYVMTLFLGCGLVVILQGHWVAKNQELYRGSKEPTKRYLTGPNSSRLVTCSHCNFHGRVLVDDEELMCPICFGVGGRYVKRKDTSDRFCMLCDGMGRVLDGKGVSSQNCPVCDGRGVKYMAYGTRFCTNCEGLGSEFDPATKVSGVCSLCDGTGAIFEDVAFCSSCRGEKTVVDRSTGKRVPCPVCDLAASATGPVWEEE